jgi:hypothetical protein
MLSVVRCWCLHILLEIYVLHFEKKIEQFLFRHLQVFGLTYKQVGDISIAIWEIIYTCENRTDATFNTYNHHQIM